MSYRSSLLIVLCLVGCSSADSTNEVDVITYAGTEYGSKVPPAVCGNGVIEAGEACDDGKTGLCPRDCQCSFKYGEHCYLVAKADSGWDASLAACQDLGMHLASLTTLDEFKYVVDATLPLIADVGDGFWIGANDQMIEGEFVWDDGEPLGAETKSMWSPGEPTIFGPPISCVGVYPMTQQFRVTCCHYPQSFVCESL